MTLTLVPDPKEGDANNKAAAVVDGRNHNFQWPNSGINRGGSGLAAMRPSRNTKSNGK